MSEDNKKAKVLVITITFIACITLVGIGLAYFSSTISNTNHETINAHTASISMTFDDNDNGISGVLNLGESITKKFTLENTSAVDAYAKINWYNLVNSYTKDSLSYTLEQAESENGEYTKVANGLVPVSASESTKVLKNGLLIPASTKYYYKLTITLVNLPVNQNNDIDARFYSYFNAEEGNLTGVSKILDLANGADASSTDIINAEAVSSTCTNTLAYDGTSDNNLRYVGANPCNYVTFNGEEAGWRIIGVMNNVDDGNGNLGSRIKLVRTNFIGNYSWDSSLSTVNQGRGVNDWTQADLKNELNGDYLNSNLAANTLWFNGTNNLKTAEFDYTKALNSSAQKLIGNAKWHLGSEAFTFYSNEEEGTSAKFYGYERGDKVWGEGECSDGACPRATSWSGKVALMYPSDYGFAVGGANRSLCLNKNINVYSEDDCYTNNWIYSNNLQWLLSPDLYGPRFATVILDSGEISAQNTDSIYGVKPSVYLSENVSITNGSGTPENPFVLS